MTEDDTADRRSYIGALTDWFREALGVGGDGRLVESIADERAEGDGAAAASADETDYGGEPGEPSRPRTADSGVGTREADDEWIRPGEDSTTDTAGSLKGIVTVTDDISPEDLPEGEFLRGGSAAAATAGASNGDSPSVEAPTEPAGPAGPSSGAVSPSVDDDGASDEVGEFWDAHADDGPSSPGSSADLPETGETEWSDFDEGDVPRGATGDAEPETGDPSDVDRVADLWGEDADDGPTDAPEAASTEAGMEADAVAAEPTVGEPLDEDPFESVEEESEDGGIECGEEDGVYVLPKREYCEGCEHFEAPPGMGCSAPGAEIIELVDMEHLRVKDCPIVEADLDRDVE